MEKIDRNLNKIILDTKVQMVMKNGSVRAANVVIFIGNTGSGKSTLACLIAGKNVKIKLENGIIELDCEGSKSGGKSFTDLPEIINDELNGLTLIDTPGQKDTKGYVQQIKNAFSIHDLFNSNNKENKVKIILVIRAEEVGVVRSDSVQNLFNRLDEMFPKLTDSEKKAIGIVFSCEIRNQKGLYYINKLNNNANEATSKWCYYFKNHLDQVFILPEANGENGQSFVYNDKWPLIDFCKKNQLINPKPELSFDDDAKLYLQGGFSNHIFDLFQEVGRIFQKIDDLYQTSTNINELNIWSQKLLNFSKIPIRSPSILKNAIESSIADKNNFKKEFERLDELSVLHKFYIDALKINELDITERIKKPIDKKISKLISKFDAHKKLVIEKQEAERKRQDEERKRLEAENKKQEAEQRKDEAERKRKDEERKRLEAERKRQEEERKRLEAEHKMQEEKQKRIEKEKEIEENRKRLQFSQENNIKIKQLSKNIKDQLGKDGIITLNSDDRNGIFKNLTIDQILVTSNSVRPGSNPDNVISSDDNNYYSEDKVNSYICFNFLRRKVKIDYYNIFYAQYNKNCLIHYRIEGSNDTNIWDTIITVDDYDSHNNPNAKGNLYTIDHPYYPKEDEYKLYYKYIRITQTGYSYDSYSYVMGINNIEFFGNISEPIDI